MGLPADGLDVFMAVVTKGNEGKKPMADDDEDLDDESREKRVAPAGPVSTGGGWFSIYKPGQGYWTRMGTVAGAALVVLGLAQFIYREILGLTNLHNDVKAGIVAGFLLACAIILWRVLNKPNIVDFFIATESEMKKVNWTTRKELTGSTKVVIVFMFLIAAVLFLYDLFFGYMFALIKVLHHGPFS